jgi:RNase P protein component
MLPETVELIKKLNKVSDISVTVKESFTVNHNQLSTSFDLIFVQKNKTFKENQAMVGFCKTENQLQQELNCLIFKFE